MFRQAKNIDTAFRQTRTTALVVIVCCFTFLAYREYTAFKREAAKDERLYVLYDGKVLEAIASNRKDNIAVEARDHISRFHELFFSLDPDEKVITGNISKALYLADASAKKQYDNLKENGYYSGLISANISQRITIDSISLGLDSHPYHFRCMATETITRSTSIVTRSLVTEGNLRNLSRSDNNPHGFLIERWTILQNKDVNIQSR